MGSEVVKIDPLRFVARCRKRRLTRLTIVVYYLSFLLAKVSLCILLFITDTFVLTLTCV